MKNENNILIIVRKIEIYLNKINFFEKNQKKVYVLRKIYYI